MQMQDGVGRSGYRVLAGVFLGLGVLGLVTTLYAFQQATDPRGLFDWLGFGLSFVSLVALFALAMVILVKPARENPEPARPAPVEFHAAMPKRPETGPEVAVPLVSPAPPREATIVPPNRNLERDTKGWPRRQPPSGLTMGERRELESQAVQLLATTAGTTAGIEFEAAPSRPPRAARPAANGSARPAATAHEEMAIRAVPAIVARVAGPNDDPAWNPPGVTKGRCGSCDTMLYAPPQRPLNLRCPKCSKVTLLQ